jgi:hypothetical protein
MTERRKERVMIMTEDEDVVASQGDLRVILRREEYADNPREAFDQTCNVVMVPSSYCPPDKDGGPFAEQWRRLTDGHRTRDAVLIFERYVAINEGRTLYDTPYDGPSCIWYTTPYLRRNGKWVWPQEPTADEMDALLRAERDEYRAWAEGDVWGWEVQRSVSYQRTDGQPGGEHSHWEHVDSCGGYYGRKYAEQQAREALAQRV